MTLRRTHIRSLAWSVMLAASGLVGVGAQEKGTKLPTPRITPIPTGANAVPVGPDTGTPATSESVPLGTPIKPANAAEGDAMRSQSAAARAAGRGKGVSPAASSAGCKRATVTSARRDPAESAAVALPGSGFVGSSASPSTRSSIAKVTVVGDCL